MLVDPDGLLIAFLLIGVLGFMAGYVFGDIGSKERETELLIQLEKTENTLQKYARYANKEAMKRDIRLIGDSA